MNLVVVYLNHIQFISTITEIAFLFDICMTFSLFMLKLCNPNGWIFLHAIKIHSFYI